MILHECPIGIKRFYDIFKVEESNRLGNSLIGKWVLEGREGEIIKILFCPFCGLRLDGYKDEDDGNTSSDYSWSVTHKEAN